jgi:membrane protein implicated in regulation of membrane protease activity
VTLLILLVLVAFLWVAVLAPSAWRRFGERQGVGSIDHFHHQLQLLEHAGPKTVVPAYRLHTAMPGGEPAEASAPAVDSSRPKLVLLRPTDDAAAADVDDGDGAHYERIGVLDRPEPACVPEMSADLSAFRREQARRRCTMLLRCLCGVAISTGLIGMWPGMHLAWIFTVLSGLAALGLVGLMAYAKELEAEQRRHRSRHETAPGPFGGGGYVDPATSGYPGAWDDDDYEEPRVVAR